MIHKAFVATSLQKCCFSNVKESCPDMTILFKNVQCFNSVSKMAFWKWSLRQWHYFVAMVQGCILCNKNVFFLEYRCHNSVQSYNFVTRMFFPRINGRRSLILQLCMKNITTFVQCFNFLRSWGKRYYIAALSQKCYVQTLSEEFSSKIY